ncbi:hypothetical protein CS379_07720, partial [Methylobacterium frigidaeris]|uniref:hypothetical protein n=1 Tax=Methylobacterium frigidaeris TaxID=2038277 RepID=UPI000C35D611
MLADASCAKATETEGRSALSAGDIGGGLGKVVNLADHGSVIATEAGTSRGGAATAPGGASATDGGTGPR